MILDEYELKLYPIINSLLNISNTLSMKTTEIGHSFSTLKRIKSLPRNKIGYERLTRLDLLSIRLEVYIPPNAVLNLVAK